MPATQKPKHKRRVPKQAERNSFSEKVRKEVDARSKGICEYCHCKRATQRHHVVPRSRMGRGVYTNAIHMCYECHKLPHNSEEVMQELIEMYTQKYGKNFYKDEWDFYY